MGEEERIEEINELLEKAVKMPGLADIMRVEEANDKRIPRKVAAMEVARWVDKTRITAMGGILLMFFVLALILYEAEGYAFVVTCGAVAFFAWQLGVAVRFRNYLKSKYGV